MRFPTKFSIKLRALREKREMSQADLAREAGIAPAQLSRYEVGRALPRMEVVERLAKALDVPTKDLSTNDDLIVNVRITADMLEVLEREAKDAGGTVQDAVESRLVSSFFPLVALADQRERLEYLQSVVAAFESTSHDFEKELGERMTKHLATVMKKDPKKD